RECTAHDTCRGGQCVAGSSPKCPPGSACCPKRVGGFGSFGSWTTTCCSAGLVCNGLDPRIPCIEPGSSTSTTLPSGTSRCDAVGSFAAARCLLGQTLAAPLCQGEIPARFDESVHSKLRS